LEQDFPESMLFADFGCSSGNENHARATSLHLPRKWRSGELVLQSSRIAQEHIAPQKILLLREIRRAEANPEGGMPF
jgi:hypothetical protein